MLTCCLNPVRVSNDGEKRRFLTGVGGFIHRDFPFSAPVDSSVRYDDRGYTISRMDEFPPLIGTRFHPEPGYVFHELCWKLLEALIYPDTVPIDRFYDICHSFPVRHRSWLDWGHNYGGLLRTHPDDRHPWEEVRIVSLIAPVLGRIKNSPLSYYKKDPLCIPELEAAFAETHARRSALNDAELSGVDWEFRNYVDCFDVLPVELCEEILHQLLMGDVANVRLASRSFGRLSLSQYFWSSRFRPDFDRDYIFETRIPEYASNLDSGQRDWKALYDMTRPTIGALANRRRIWDTNRSLATLLTTTPLKEPVSASSTQNYHFPWRGVGAATTKGSQRVGSHSSPCKELYEQAVRLPREISHMAVSLVSFNEKQFVSGIRFFSDVEPNIELGYILSGKEVVLSTSGGVDKPDTLTGFIVAVGPSGIHALKPIVLSGRTMKWAGCADNLPKTLRLCMKERVSHLKGGFDVRIFSFIGSNALV